MITFTQLGALIGTVTGVTGLAWNIYLKVSAGPKLRVQAWAGMVKRPAPKGDPKFLKVTIQNIGSQPTTLTNYTLHQYASKRDRKRQQAETSAILVHYEGDHNPYKLGIGEEAQIMMEQDLSFDRAIREKTVYFAVWHAFAKHPVEVEVII